MTADSNSGLDPQLAAALRDEVVRLRGELRGEIDLLRRELGLVHPTPEASPPPAPRASEAIDIHRLLAASRALDAARTQAALLEALLDAASGFGARALFWLARGGSLQGWGGSGFAAEDGALAELKVDSPAGALASVLAGNGTTSLAPAECEPILGPWAQPLPAEAVAIPFPLRGAVAGVLYLDRSAAQPSLPVSAAQLLTYLAANALETLPLRGGLASPALRELDAATGTPPAPEAPAQPWAPPDGIPPEGPPPTPLAAAAPPAALATDAAPAPAPLTDQPAEPPPVAEEAASWQFETVAIDRRSFNAELESELPSSELAPPGPPPAEDATSEVQPPPDLVGPGWAFTSPGTVSREETRREEARRLARLLVTEIKLYNEERVAEGRERGNIYSALREDIDRSRRIFEERVPLEIRSEADYFHDELVRILADGDSGSLGT